MPDFLNPAKMIARALRAVPETRWAVAVGGLLAVVAIGASMFSDWRVGVVGVAILFFFMVLFVGFARLSKSDSKGTRVASLLLVWGVVVMFLGTAFLTITSVFFGWPQNLTSVFGESRNSHLAPVSSGAFLSYTLREEEWVPELPTKIEVSSANLHNVAGGSAACKDLARRFPGQVHDDGELCAHTVPARLEVPVGYRMSNPTFEHIGGPSTHHERQGPVVSNSGRTVRAAILRAHSYSVTYRLRAEVERRVVTTEDVRAELPWSNGRLDFFVPRSAIKPRVSLTVDSTLVEFSPGQSDLANGIVLISKNSSPEGYQFVYSTGKRSSDAIDDETLMGILTNVLQGVLWTNQNRISRIISRSPRPASFSALEKLHVEVTGPQDLAGRARELEQHIYALRRNIGLNALSEFRVSYLPP